MAKRAWAFRRGNFIPYVDESAVKRRRLDAAAEVLAATGNIEAAGALEAAGNLFSGPTANVRALGRQAFSRNLQRAFSKRGMAFRRSFRNRRRRWRGRRRRMPFRARVKSALLSLVEPRSNTDPFADATYTAGDGTTKVLYITSPIGNMVNSTSDFGFDGNTIYIKGFKVRGRVRNDEPARAIKMDIWCIATRQFADLPNSVTTYGSTTTFNTNPTQASGNENNIRQFDIISGTEPNVFVGDNTGMSKFDTDYVKVLGKRTVYFTANVTPELEHFKEFGLYIPINRMWSYDKDQDTTAGDQLRSIKNPNYYICWQVYTSDTASNIAIGNSVTAYMEVTTYFKDV